MAKIVLGFTGLMVSGKGTAAAYVVERYQAGSHRYSTMLRDVLQRLHQLTTRENMQALSGLLRQQFGENILAQVIAEDVRADTHDIVIVEGIRRLADIEYLRQLPEFHLIAIEAEESIRYQRLITRGENPDDASKTREQFALDQQAEPEQAIPSVMEQAEYRINNDGSVEALQQQLDQLLTSLGYASKI